MKKAAARPVAPVKKRAARPHLAVTTPQRASKAKVMVFGPPNSGKTYFLGTADDDERTSPTLFLSFEGGEHTLVGRDIAMWEVNDWKDYNEAYAELSREDTPYKSVCVDSLSETQVSGLLQQLARSGPTGRADPDQLAESDWGVILVQMRRFVREFKALKMHVFMSALSKSTLDPKAGRITVPAFSGQFADEVPGVFDVVGYMAEVSEGDEVWREILLSGNPKFRIKARTPMGVVPPFGIEDPDVTKLLDALHYE